MNLYGLPKQDPGLFDATLPPDLLAIGIREWLALIFRAHMRANCKTVALHIAYCSQLDGTGARARAPHIALMSNLSEARTGEHVEALIGMGLLHLKHEAGPDSLYRLTQPADLSELPLWLDENMNRIPGYKPGGAR